MFINGDCLEEMKKFGDKSFDYGFTSPPYNRLRNDKYKNYSDTKTNYYDFLCNFTDELKRLCKKAFFVNIQKTMYNKQDVLKYIGTYCADIQEVFIWEKTNPMPANGKNLTNSYEFFLYFSETPAKAHHTYTKNVFRTAVNSQMPKEHKAVMKQEVADYFISEFFEPNTSCIDCFGGLGTTEIACNKNNINCVSIELSPEYCAMAEQRIKNCQLELF